MNGFQVLRGGRAAQAVALGQTHSSVVSSEVESELGHRGYAVVHTVVIHEPVVPTLTKSMAINVAIDEGIQQMGVPRTVSHYYTCPAGASCGIAPTRWVALVNWCVNTANGYLAGTYSLPTWAQGLFQNGNLHGVALGGLGGFTDWVQSNPWFLQSVGDSISNYGEHLTAKNVQDAIKANTEQQLTKADAMALVQALQSGGYVPQGKTAAVAQGASMAASPSWMMPLLIGGGILAVVLLMKR